MCGALFATVAVTTVSHADPPPDKGVDTDDRRPEPGGVISPLAIYARLKIRQIQTRSVKLRSAFSWLCCNLQRWRLGVQSTYAPRVWPANYSDSDRSRGWPCGHQDCFACHCGCFNKRAAL